MCFSIRPGGCLVGLTAPYSLRLGMALRQWVERQGAREEGSQRGPSTCLELWVHCLVVCERLACVEGVGAAPAFTPDPREALAPAHLLPFYLPFLVSLLYSRTLAHTWVFCPSPPLP